jgi:alpha-L-fucosidase 2
MIGSIRFPQTSASGRILAPRPNLMQTLPDMGDPGESNRLKLWYRQPAHEWLGALPISSGRLAAMVYGSVASERIQVNEESLWLGAAQERANRRALTMLPVVRHLLKVGKAKEAEDVANLNMMGEPSRLKPYQPLGELRVDLEKHDTFTDYRRELDLDDGIVRVFYRIGETRYIREVFCCAPDQVLVVRLEAHGPDKLRGRVTLTREIDGNGEPASYDSITLRGRIDEGKGLNYHAIVRAVAEGGRIITDGAAIAIEGVTAVTILLAAATNFFGENPAAETDRSIAMAGNHPYALLRDKHHLLDHRRYSRRVELDLGDPNPELDALPTDERLQRIKEGADDPGLIALYFHFGRYLLSSCSRPGSLPANLQGKWNESFKPEWNCDYHLNINFQMNYWPAEVCNLSDCHVAVFDLLEALRESGRRIARLHYGCRGFVAHHITDPWAFTAPGDRAGSGMWPMGAAWLTRHLWEHFLFGRDMQFLRESAYPAMKEAATFYLDYLTDDGAGHLITGPSVSPENSYRAKDGSEGRLCMGPAMDIQIVRDLFTHCMAASQVLNIDPEFREQLGGALAKLPPHKIDKFGQLMEWQEEYEEIEIGHRHLSHLFAVFPSEQITPRQTPEFANAARASLLRRERFGAGKTGWSRAWMMNLYARLNDGEKARQQMMEMLKTHTCENLFDLHPPRIFQIDGNLGATAGVAEMLLQSHGNEIALLPALPKSWSSGRFSGLRARGGAILGLEWKDGKPTTGTLRAAVTADHRLRASTGSKVTSITDDKGVAVQFRALSDGVIRLSVTIATTYTLQFAPA